ncbi:MAG: phosphopyruvate hydratase [Candidatus Bathyarchaeota archaeon]|nr:MAG: phosphopyruvate hydratase [Candidatus Bathyarchaeota archaeon]
MAGVIKAVRAREVFDEKGLPTVEVDVLLDDGNIGRAAAPGGTSRGASEAFDLRDGDKSYFNGLGVGKAIRSVSTEIAGGLKGKNALDQEGIDRLLIELDGTENKSRLGSNAIVATSLANAKAAAKSRGIELFEHLGDGKKMPISMTHVMYGGPAYVDMAGTCDFQEYALHALSAENCKEGFLATLRIYKKLHEIVVKNRGFGMPRLAHLAGKITATFDSNEDALSTLTELIEDEGYVPRRDFGIYLDIASSQLYRDGMYHLQRDGTVFSRGEMIDWLSEMCDKYPIISMEDCLYEDDWEGWKILTKRLGNRIQLVGDDLFVTNPRRLEKGIETGVANATVIKPNQVGTLTETIETIRIARTAGYGTIISGRSGQLWDPFLVHLCVGQILGQGKLIKCPIGGPNLNELTRIEDCLGDSVEYADRSILPTS